MYGIGLCDCVSRVSQQVIYIQKHIHIYTCITYGSLYHYYSPVYFICQSHLPFVFVVRPGKHRLFGSVATIYDISI